MLIESLHTPRRRLPSRLGAVVAASVVLIAGGGCRAASADDAPEVEGFAIDAERSADDTLPATESRWVTVLDAGDALRQARARMVRDDDREIAEALGRVAGGLRAAAIGSVTLEDGSELQARALELDELARALTDGSLHDGPYVAQVFAKAHTSLSQHYLAEARKYFSAGEVEEAGPYLRRALRELETGHEEGNVLLSRESALRIEDARALSDQWAAGGPMTDKARALFEGIERDQRQLANALWVDG